MTDALLLTYHMTDDPRYLEPLHSMADIRRAWLDREHGGAPEPGSRLWSGQKLGFLTGTLAKYRLLTGSDAFDDLLERDSLSQLGQERGADRSRLARSLRDTAEALAINFPGRTSEVRWTDRVFAWARLFGRDMLFPEAVPACNRRPNLRLLYETTTGDRGDFLVFPLNAVRWLTEPRDIAALVTDRGQDRFAAELFHFGTGSRAMQAELYLLREGSYTYTLVSGNGAPVVSGVPFQVDGPRTRIDLSLPPQTLCRLQISAR